MQLLTIKKRGPDGKEIDSTVSVLRCFQDASFGMQIYLHANGDYAYKDGSPVKSEKELMQIGDRRQRDIAMLWWKSVGEKKSQKFYADRDSELAKKIGDFQPDPKSETDLDFVLYQSRQVGGKEKDWSDPFPWMGKFPKRPDWWGQMVSAVFNDIEYRKAKTADAGSGSTGSGSTGSPGGSVKGI